MVYDPGVVPQEAVDYLEQKELHPSFSYQDVWKEEHTRAFTVAKCMELDLLKDIQDSLVAAIKEGVPYEAWAKDITDTMVKAGWWGRQKMVDPLTGEVKTVQLGSTRRIRTIFETNLTQAYQTGAWQRGYGSKAHTHIIYRVGPSRHHRPEHLSWDGVCLPKDDPWWDTHQPPLGWGCKCYTKFLTRSQVERLGKEGIPDITSMSNGRPTRTKAIKLQAPQDTMVSYVNRRTGKVYTLPKGIDPGFEFNPGKVDRSEVKLTRVYRQKLAQTTQAVIGDTVPTNTATPVSAGITKVAPKYKDTAQKVLAIIDSIHGDGSLPGIPVKASTARSFAGAYKYYGGSNIASEIALSTYASHPELTLAHELGHYLDHQAFGSSRGYASSRRDYDPMTRLLDGIEQSAAIQAIKVSSSLSRQMKSYYLDRQEMVARSYAQYIAAKSQDQEMLSQLNSILQSPGDYKNTQWTSDDFVPIMKLYEEMFEDLGWQAKR